MPHSNEKLRVCLDPRMRGELEALCRKGSVPAAKLRHARILLLADENHEQGRCADWEIAEIVGLSQRQVVRIRQRFVRDGLAPAIDRKRRSRPGTRPKFDGEAEARLVMLCCSTPPEGQQRWTLQLLADELCRLQIVASVCPETVRKCLKKIASSPGKAGGSVFPNETAPVSWLTWKRSSTFTAKATIASIH